MDKKESFQNFESFFILVNRILKRFFILPILRLPFWY